jgi:hypothetical protein
MANPKLIFSLLVVTITSCNSASNKQPLAGNKDTVKHIKDPLSVSVDVDKEVHGKKQYCEITQVIKSGDTTYINADYIQFLTGQEAIKAAITHHQADTFKTGDGKIQIDVPNDYYIVNDNKKIRRLQIDKNCVFDLEINPDRLHKINDNSLESLTRIYKDSPFILTLNDNNLVVGIKEVFLP